MAIITVGGSGDVIKTADGKIKGGNRDNFINPASASGTDGNPVVTPTNFRDRGVNLDKRQNDIGKLRDKFMKEKAEKEAALHNAPPVASDMPASLYLKTDKRFPERPLEDVDDSEEYESVADMVSRMEREKQMTELEGSDKKSDRLVGEPTESPAAPPAQRTTLMSALPETSTLAEMRKQGAVDPVETAPSRPATSYTIEDTDSLLAKIYKHIDTAILLDSEAHPLALLIAMFAWFEKDALEWEPETLWFELEALGVKQEIPEITKNKIMAIRGVHRINDFFSDWRSFELVGTTLNNNIPNFHKSQPLTLNEITNAMNILDKIRKDDDYDITVKAYVSVIARNEGFIVLPKDIAFLNETMDKEYAERIYARAAELEAFLNEPFKIESMDDCQAIRIAEVNQFCKKWNEKFSSDINKYFIMGE